MILSLISRTIFTYVCYYMYSIYRLCMLNVCINLSKKISTTNCELPQQKKKLKLEGSSCKFIIQRHIDRLLKKKKKQAAGCNTIHEIQCNTKNIYLIIQYTHTHRTKLYIKKKTHETCILRTYITSYR